MKLLIVIAAITIGAGAAQAGQILNQRWSQPVTRWHLALAPHSTFVTLRQVGVAAAAATADDTKVVTLVDGLGNPETTHSARWKFIRLPAAVPSKAKAVRLSFRAAITRGQNAGDAVVYAFVRTPGATCCDGPPGFLNYPVDFSLSGKKLDGSDDQRPPMVVQADAVGVGGSYRGWQTVDLPIRDHGFQFAWGYRRTMGTWPSGDAVAVAVYVDGWAE